MFQTFNVIGGPQHGAERARALRAELATRGLTGFMLPRADEFQNEYVAPEAEHLLWLTGFSGSWGTAVILASKAVLFVDGRYTLQAATQVDGTVYEIVNVSDLTIAHWLAANLRKGDRLGFDPRLHTISQIELLREEVEKAGAELVAVEPSPIPAIWHDRPAPRILPVEAQPLAFAGRSAAGKIAELQAGLVEAKRDAVVLSALDSIAWLFNIRGQDLPHTPFVHAYAVVPAEGKARLFVDGYKVGKEVRDSFADVAEIAAPEALSAALAQLGEAGATVQLDPASASAWLLQILADAGASIVRERDPCALPKARKNKAEIDGSRAAHLRDGAAVSRFLAWVDAEAPKGALDEIAVATKLEEFRRATNLLRDVSFDTIAGSGANGAIVHYRPSEATSRRIDMDSLLLVDSGGQYQDGTTDITRTIAVGTPSADMVRHYTLVLKGHIAISTLRFPKGTRGSHLDAFARRPLWGAGLDYDHGTGHGVGSFLSVHEGPQSIAKRESVELEPGMILSNEPGFYRAGAYGIRIENLVLVKEPESIPGGERPMMSFETLTLAPYDRRLIDAGLLSEAERAWIDTYHARVRETLAPQLEGDALRWLELATAPLRTS
jgi:Xaa-Pro aminopeptidase